MKGKFEMLTEKLSDSEEGSIRTGHVGPGSDALPKVDQGFGPTVICDVVADEIAKSPMEGEKRGDPR